MYIVPQKRRQRRRKASVVVVFLVIIVLIVFFNMRINRFVRTAAPDAATQHCINICDTTVWNVMEQNNTRLTASERLMTNEQGVATALQMNTAHLNQLRGDIAIACGRQLNNDSTISLSVPIGQLFTDEWANGFGPNLTLPVRLSSTVRTDCQSRYQAAGINGILTQTVLTVKVNGYCRFWGISVPYSYETEYVVAQTVLVGQIPDAYTAIGSTVDEETKNNIINFAAS